MNSWKGFATWVGIAVYLTLVVEFARRPTPFAQLLAAIGAAGRSSMPCSTWLAPRGGVRGHRRPALFRDGLFLNRAGAVAVLLTLVPAAALAEKKAALF